MHSESEIRAAILSHSWGLSIEQRATLLLLSGNQLSLLMLGASVSTYSLHLRQTRVVLQLYITSNDTLVNSSFWLRQCCPNFGNTKINWIVLPQYVLFMWWFIMDIGSAYPTHPFSKQAVKDVLYADRVCVLDIDMAVSRLCNEQCCVRACVRACACECVCVCVRVCVWDQPTYLQGVRSMKETDLNPVYVLIKPPSIEELVSYPDLWRAVLKYLLPPSLPPSLPPPSSFPPPPPRKSVWDTEAVSPRRVWNKG